MNDEQIRDLFEEAVGDVSPREGLDAIRARTRHPSGRRAWRWVSAGAVVATAATIAAVAALSSGPRTPAEHPVVAGSTGVTKPHPSAGRTQTTKAAEPTPPVAAGKPTAVPVYFAGSTSHGPRLFREFHQAPSGDHELDEAVQDAVAGSADDPDYGSPWPSGTMLQRAQLSAGVLSVDLSGPVTERPAGMSAATARLALQQLVYTAQAVVQDRVPVTFLVDGRPASTVLGIPVAGGVTQSSADDVLAQVWVTSPTDGATVTSPFRVEGVAAAFEANVQWELEQGGRVVQRGFATAAECCTMSPYSFTVDAAPGTYTLVVHDEDPSGGEGPGPWQDTKQLAVQ
jgi:Immunoglobulin-like domain of bacterial spore germination/Sporulation and spore germination